MPRGTFENSVHSRPLLTRALAARKVPVRASPSRRRRRRWESLECNLKRSTFKSVIDYFLISKIAHLNMSPVRYVVDSNLDSSPDSLKAACYNSGHSVTWITKEDPFDNMPSRHRSFAFMKPETLRRALLSETESPSNPLRHPTFAIVDVRSPREFAQGHIRGAKNLPLANLSSLLSVSALDARLRDLGVLTTVSKKETNLDRLIIHCRLSLVRGPEAAAHVCRLLDKGVPPKLASTWTKTEICLLEGGFKGWERMYGSDPRLYEVPDGSL